MKKNILTFILLLTVVWVTAQTKYYLSNTAQKPVTVQSAEKNIPVPKLPDFKISALNVIATHT